MFAVKTTRGRATTVAAATTLIAAGFVGFSGSAANAAAATYTVAPATGATGVDVVVAITGKAFKVGTTVKTGVLEVALACGTTAANTTDVDSVAANLVGVTSATRLVATLTSVPLVDSKKTSYKICVFNAAGTTLMGSTTWTAYPVPTITGVNGDTADTASAGGDASGPRFGGATVTIEGTNFTPKATVKINNVAATNVKYIDETSLTATAPAGTGTGVNVQITTEGGATAANSWYDYIYALDVSPKSGPLSLAQDITVTGSGFSSLTWTGVSKARVFLLSGAYDATDAGSNSLPDNGYVGECTNPQIVSDSELTCTVPSYATAGPTRVVLVPVTTAGALSAAGAVTQLSSGSTYTFAAF